MVECSGIILLILVIFCSLFIPFVYNKTLKLYKSSNRNYYKELGIEYDRDCDKMLKKIYTQDTWPYSLISFLASIIFTTLFLYFYNLSNKGVNIDNYSILVIVMATNAFNFLMGYKLLNCFVSRSVPI